MRIIAKLWGGSHLYGTNSETSDIVVRGVYVHTDPLKILGLSCKSDSSIYRKNSDGKDVEIFELRDFFENLRKGEKSSFDLLFAPKEKFIEVSEEFLALREGWKSLVDVKAFFHSSIGQIVSFDRFAVDSKPFNAKMVAFGRQLAITLNHFSITRKIHVDLNEIPGALDTILGIRYSGLSDDSLEKIQKSSIQMARNAEFVCENQNWFFPEIGFRPEFCNRFLTDIYREFLN